MYKRQPSGAAIVRGHRASLVIAVQNLLNNAVQHNHDSGSISIAVASDAKHATLTIENTGPAYAADEADELRQPFNRGVFTRQSGTPGTGLGLSIVESIANAHGGALLIVPGATNGLTVSLTIPQPRAGRERGRDIQSNNATTPSRVGHEPQ